jgi:dihydrolipoamide dehydrogenase
MSVVEIKVPDIGDFDGVEVIDVLVAVGDSIEENQDIITLESDKAAMEIPATDAGVVTALNVSVGDKVSEGDVILSVEVAGEATTSAPAPAEEAAPAPKAETVSEAPKVAAAPVGDADMHAEVLVLGSGPGGYTAAFRAADLGKKSDQG